MTLLRFFIGFVTVLSACSITQQSTIASNIHVIAVGINKYDELPNLKAAQEDALQTVRLLNAAGASTAHLFLDEEATLAAVKHQWFDTVEQSLIGDHLVFYFAGHGTTEPEHLKSSEIDRLDETLLLSGFEADKGLAERIPDDLLHDWIVFAIKKGLEVTVFLDTSFHKAGREIEGLTSRGLTLRNIDWQPHPELDQMSLGDRPVEGAHYVTAAIKGDSLFEFPQEGRLGGTLVAALARALACQSTSARSYNEVTFALYTQVFEAVENHQHLSLVPQSKDWDDFLPCIKRNSLPSETATLSGVDQIQLQNSSLSLVASRSKSDYHWQSESQILFNSSGSVVASVEKISSLPATIESHQSRMALAVNNRSERLIQLSPKRQSFWSGDRLKIDFEFPENRINSVVYFDATGRSSFLVKSRVSYEKQTEEMTVNVTPPFGHETLVLMSDSLDEPNRELWAQLHQEPILLDDLLNALDEIKASSLRTDAETFLTLEKP